MKREREESFVRFGVTTVANRSHQDRDIASTVFVILSGWSAELRRWPRFCRHRPTPGLFHLLFTGRWFLKESLRNNYYRGQSLARIQRNRLFQEHSERATTVGTRFLLSRRWKRGVELETREEERQIERERMRKGNVGGRLGENIMRKALRVLRGLYSARHYRRSFLVYEFHPSSFPSSFLPFSFPLSSFSPLGYFLYFFLFPSPARFFFFFYYFLSHSFPLKAIMLPAQCPPMRIVGNDCWFRTRRVARQTDITVEFLIITSSRLPLLLLQPVVL